MELKDYLLYLSMLHNPCRQPLRYENCELCSLLQFGGSSSTAEVTWIVVVKPTVTNADGATILTDDQVRFGYNAAKTWCAIPEVSSRRRLAGSACTPASRDIMETNKWSILAMTYNGPGSLLFCIQFNLL